MWHNYSWKVADWYDYLHVKRTIQHNFWHSTLSMLSLAQPLKNIHPLWHTIDVKNQTLSSTLLENLILCGTVIGQNGNWSKWHPSHPSIHILLSMGVPPHPPGKCVIISGRYSMSTIPKSLWTSENTSELSSTSQSYGHNFIIAQDRTGKQFRVLSLGDTNAMWYSDNHSSATLKYLLLIILPPTFKVLC